MKAPLSFMGTLLLLASALNDVHIVDATCTSSVECGRDEQCVPAGTEVSACGMCQSTDGCASTCFVDNDCSTDGSLICGAALSCQCDTSFKVCVQPECTTNSDCEVLPEPRKCELGRCVPKPCSTQSTDADGGATTDECNTDFSAEDTFPWDYCDPQTLVCTRKRCANTNSETCGSNGVCVSGLCQPQRGFCASTLPVPAAPPRDAMAPTPSSIPQSNSDCPKGIESVAGVDNRTVLATERPFVNGAGRGYAWPPCGLVAGVVLVLGAIVW